MTADAAQGKKGRKWSRREILWCSLAGTTLAFAGLSLARLLRRPAKAETFAARDRLRILVNLGLSYGTTAAQLRAVLAGIE